MRWSWNGGSWAFKRQRHVFHHYECSARVAVVWPFEIFTKSPLLYFFLSILSCDFPFARAFFHNIGFYVSSPFLPPTLVPWFRTRTLFSPSHFLEFSTAREEKKTEEIKRGSRLADYDYSREQMRFVCFVWFDQIFLWLFKWFLCTLENSKRS